MSEGAAVFLNSLASSLPSSTEGQGEGKLIKTKVSLAVGDFEESKCACVASYECGERGIQLRQESNIKPNTVTVSISFEVAKDLDRNHLNVLFDGAENLGMLFFGDSLYNLEEHLGVVDGRSIYSLNLDLPDKSICDNALKLVNYYKTETFKAELHLSQSPKKEEKDARANKFVEAKFLLDCDVHHGIGKFIEGVFVSAQQQSQLMEQHRQQQQEALASGGSLPPVAVVATPTPSSPSPVSSFQSKLFGFSELLKRFSITLAFDSIQEMFESSFAKKLPEQYRMLNWDTISNSIYEPILHLICSKDKNDQRMAEAYSKLEYLQRLHSIKLVVADHVFAFRFQDFEIFDLLPPKEVLEEAKLQREEEEKEREKEQQEKEAKTNSVVEALSKSQEELKAEALQQLKLSAGKRAKQDGKALLKVLLLGDEGVGKTCLLSRLVHDRLPGRVRPTDAADVTTSQIQLDDLTVTLKLWDSAGQAGFTSPDVAFYKGADVVLLVFDVKQAASFEALEGWHNQFMNHTKLPNPASFPFLVLGNKAGEEESEKERQVTKEQAERWCASKGPNVTYIEVSAKEGKGVKQAFEFAALKALC